jgi:hypothetical protein
VFKNTEFVQRTFSIKIAISALPKVSAAKGGNISYEEKQKYH